MALAICGYKNCSQVFNNLENRALAVKISSTSARDAHPTQCCSMLSMTKVNTSEAFYANLNPQELNVKHYASISTVNKQRLSVIRTFFCFVFLQTQRQLDDQCQFILITHIICVHRHTQHGWDQLPFIIFNFIKSFHTHFPSLTKWEQFPFPQRFDFWQRKLCH